MLPIACATALAVVFVVSLPQPAHAGQVRPPAVPPNIEVPAGNRAFLEGHGVGTQNYVCVPSASSTSGVAYVLFTPEATLFSDGKEIITHFFSPDPNPLDPNTNPKVVADGAIRVTWQHARDSSTVWGRVRPSSGPSDPGDSSTDHKFVADKAIAWLKVTVTGTEDGPTGRDTLTKTTFVQRLNTHGGLAPSTGCDSPLNVGNQAFVDYTADYFFYTGDKGDADDGN